MRCEDCYLMKPVKGVIGRCTCAHDHKEEKTIRNMWDGCNLLDDIHEVPSKVSCVGCGSEVVLVSTELPVKRVVVEEVRRDPHRSTLQGSHLEPCGEPKHIFSCAECGKSWPVPSWFRTLWGGKPMDVTHMTKMEIARHMDREPPFVRSYATRCVEQEGMVFRREDVEKCIREPTKLEEWAGGEGDEAVINKLYEESKRYLLNDEERKWASIGLNRPGVGVCQYIGCYHPAVGKREIEGCVLPIEVCETHMERNW